MANSTAKSKNRNKNDSNRLVLLIQKYFGVVYTYMKKADLSKGYQNPKRKSGISTHFSEIIELKFGKKLS